MVADKLWRFTHKMADRECDHFFFIRDPTLETLKMYFIAFEW